MGGTDHRWVRGERGSRLDREGGTPGRLGMWGPQVSHGREHPGRPGQAATQNRGALDSVWPAFACKAWHVEGPALGWVQYRTTRRRGWQEGEEHREERVIRRQEGVSDGMGDRRTKCRHKLPALFLFHHSTVFCWVLFLLFLSQSKLKIHLIVIYHLSTAVDSGNSN